MVIFIMYIGRSQRNQESDTQTKDNKNDNQSSCGARDEILIHVYLILLIKNRDDNKV